MTTKRFTTKILHPHKGTNTAALYALSCLTLALALSFWNLGAADAFEGQYATLGVKAQPAQTSSARIDATETVDPLCTLKDVHCPKEQPEGRVVRATVTTYQAVTAQTDASPCIGAMAGIDFCNPPFPLVANDRLPLGSRVVIRGVTYTVADRFGAGKSIEYFDILTDGWNDKWYAEPVTIL